MHGQIARRGVAWDRLPEVQAQGWTRLCQTVSYGPSGQPRRRITDDVERIGRGETTPNHHLLRPDLRDRVGDVAVRDFRGLRAAGSSPHRDPYKPGSCGAQGARLADDPLACEVVLVRGGYRTSACGTPGYRRAQLRCRVGPPVADVQLPYYLPHGVRRAPGQPDGRAVGRAPGLERGCPPWAAGTRLLAAGVHRDPGAARSPVALAPLLLGAWRLAALCPRERPRGDDGGDVLVHVALQPHRRQHPAARHRARHRRKHPVRARLDRHGRVVGGCDRVGRLRLEALARSCACACDDGTVGTAQRSGTSDARIACTLYVGLERKTQWEETRDEVLDSS